MVASPPILLCRVQGISILYRRYIFSVTTGVVPVAEDGRPLWPQILSVDGRSHKQAREIRERVAEEKFLRETCNLPVSGGSSLCSILWIRENQPEIWNATRHDLTWNRDILALAEIPKFKLPPLMQSYHRVGRILP